MDIANYHIEWKPAESIHGDYAVGVVGPEETPIGWILVPTRNRKKRYEVEKSSEGWWICNCPDFIFRQERDGSLCKHIKILIECGIAVDERIGKNIPKSTRIG